VRLACLAFLAALTLVASPAAATLDPRALVVAGADVPSGYLFDPRESGIRPNGGASVHAQEQALYSRSGRITGYEVTFRRGSTYIRSRADLFRANAGPKVVLDWFDAETKRSGIKGLRRERTEIGVESWIYWAGRAPVSLNLVAWRQGRVFAGIVGFGLTKQRTLQLARAQQRRIVAALR
jgi:hypothetical protein